MRRRPSTLALAICSAAVLFAPTVGVAPAGAAVATARDVPGMRALLDIWCTADGSCLGVGYTPQNVGAVVVLEAVGPSGPVRAVPGTTSLAGVACGQAGVCLAVGKGQTGGVVVDVSPSGMPGAVRPVAGADDMHEVACPTATTCLATGSVLNTQEPLHFYPTTWPVFSVISGGQPAAAQTFPRGTRRMIGVACPTTTTCLATGNDAIAVLTQVSGTWTAELRVVGGSLDTGYPTDAISCRSSTTCYATAAGFIRTRSGYVGVPAMMSVSASGSVGPVLLLSWQSGTSTDISCASGRTCTVVGQDNLAAQGVVIDVWSGSPAPPQRVANSNFLSGVSCVAPGTCGVVGGMPAGAVAAWHGPPPL